MEKGKKNSLHKITVLKVLTVIICSGDLSFKDVRAQKFPRTDFF